MRKLLFQFPGKPLHFPGALQDRRRNFRASQNAGKLTDGVFFVQLPDMCRRSVIFYCLGNFKMMIRHGGDLRQVRDAENLVALPDSGHLFRNSLRCPAAEFSAYTACYPP